MRVDEFIALIVESSQHITTVQTPFFSQVTPLQSTLGSRYRAPPCPAPAHTLPLQLTLPHTFPTSHKPNHPPSMPPSQHHLIDVRSPVEFATGPLKSDIAPTVNSEYQSIAQLADIYGARGIRVAKDDNITLYCRSGRRSNIALQTLTGLGYTDVRDIGGLEDARRVLDKEMVGRQMDAEIGDVSVLKEGEGGEEVENENTKKHGRAKSFGALVEGLKALEE
jgi:rhodanese-related sulfurtransferase